MRATEFEFHHRFWFIALTYLVGFGLYNVDHMNAVEALAHLTFGRGDPHLDSRAARHTLQALFALSATLVTASAFIRTWGGAYLRAEVVHDTRVHAERLVADGPYRHLRNPLYLGNMLMAVGFAMVASRTGAVVLILGNLLIVWRLIGREEAAMTQGQGEAYRAYQSAVPSLWPSLRPRLPAGAAQPIWMPAFLHEAWIWIFAVEGYVFAWTLNGRLYSILIGSSAALCFLGWGVGRRLWRRKSLPPSADLPGPQIP